MEKQNSLIANFLKFLAINIARVSILGLALFFGLLIRISEWIVYALSFIGKYFDVTILHEVEGGESFDSTPRFSQDEIYTMYEQLKGDETIKEIEDKFGISYRQARKIKQLFDSPIINKFSLVNKGEQSAYVRG